MVVDGDEVVQVHVQVLDVEIDVDFKVDEDEDEYTCWVVVVDAVVCDGHAVVVEVLFDAETIKIRIVVKAHFL